VRSSTSDQTQPTGIRTKDLAKRRFNRVVRQLQFL